jgi:uncharacterized membrane protein HdeD (DUF308 family)
VPLVCAAISVLSFHWTTTEQVTVRRSPKYLAFMIAGIIVGIIAAMVLTFSLPNDSEFTLTQIFGFMLLITGTLGGTLGLVFALIVDRYYSRHVAQATAEHIEVTKK